MTCPGLAEPRVRAQSSGLQVLGGVGACAGLRPGEFGDSSRPFLFWIERSEESDTGSSLIESSGVSGCSASLRKNRQKSRKTHRGFRRDVGRLQLWIPSNSWSQGLEGSCVKGIRFMFWTPSRREGSSSWNRGKLFLKAGRFLLTLHTAHHLRIAEAFELQASTWFREAPPFLALALPLPTKGRAGARV